VLSESGWLMEGPPPSLKGSYSICRISSQPLKELRGDVGSASAQFEEVIAPCVSA
jgi:hypothetical protein